jgi:hypothetical protein
MIQRAQKVGQRIRLQNQYSIGRNQIKGRVIWRGSGLLAAGREEQHRCNNQKDKPVQMVSHTHNSNNQSCKITLFTLIVWLSTLSSLSLYPGFIAAESMIPF